MRLAGESILSDLAQVLSVETRAGHDIDPHPHQFEAVYEHLLARPVVCALLAHDAGAGKTIMAVLVIKELKRRQEAALLANFIFLSGNKPNSP
jgi:N12 class adenine-specific DNA methylase